MKKRFVKALALVMAAAMMLTACGGGGSTSGTQTGGDATTGTETTAGDSTSKELVEITVMVYDRGHEYKAPNTLVDNEFTRWVNEQLNPQGVKVTYVPVPRSGADDKVNLMLTGGTAPDIIRTYDLQRVQGYANDGGLADLTDYVDMLDESYLSRAMLEIGVINGRQYGLPGIVSTPQRAKEMFIRQDLLEAANIPMPTNKTELIDTLYKLKDAYPDMTIMGFGGKNTNGNYENFLLSYTSRANERDNYIYEGTFTCVLKPGHKDGLRQLNQLVLDGIIDKNFVTDTDNAKYDEAVANGDYAFIMDGSAASIDDAYDTAVANNPDYKMVQIQAMEDLDGSYDNQSSGSWDHMIYVPATAEDRIEAVMTYLAFVSKLENSIEIKNGLLGLGYEIVDGKIVGFSRDQRIENGTSTQPSDNGFLWGDFPETMEEKIENYKIGNPEVPADVAESRVNMRYSGTWHKAEVTDYLEENQYAPNLNKLIVEFVFQCMLAPEGQFDAVYEKAYQTLVDANLNDLLDARAAWYDANKAN